MSMPSQTPPGRFAWTFHPAAALTTDATCHEAWDQLNARSGAQPFLDARAVALALEVFGTGDERLAVARRGDETLAMMVLSRNDPFRWTSFQPSQLPLGAWLATPGTDLGPLTRSLLAALPGFALIVSLTQADPLALPRPADGPALRTDDYIDTGWVELAGSYEDYWSARGKNLRQNMRKQRNKLATDGITANLRTLTAAGDMAAAVARYGELESAGWKSGLGTAIHAGNDQGRFYTRLLEDAAGQGEAVVFEYWLDNSLAASNLCLRRDGTLIILKTTYDERHAQLSPAFLLLQAEIESFFTDGSVSRIEFFGRMKDWHTRWTECRRALYHITAYRSTWVRSVSELRRRHAGSTT